MAQRSGTRPNHAKMARQAGSGPASGNGNSSRAAESPAAAHVNQGPDTLKVRGIQGKVYRIRRLDCSEPLAR